MTVPQRFYAILIAAALGLSASDARAQGLQPGPSPTPRASSQPAPQPDASNPSHSFAPIPIQTAPLTPTAKPSPASRPSAHSLLDEPATPAQIHLANDQLSITATNASLSEVIRQVATDTGMQVEGNSRDQRVFGSYGPGSPPEVLSALLYDSGYNVIMIGATADGAPRRLVLSTRSVSSTAPAVAATTHSDEDDEETPEAPPPPAANPAPPAASGASPTPGQFKTPQQMLEELQRMHQGQQPQDTPHDNN